MSARARMPRQSGPDFADIKDALIRNLPALVDHVAPGGKRNGIYYMPRNPVRRDHKPGSFWIIMEGNSAGVFKDEADPEAQGDVIALVHYCMRHTDMKQTRQWCIAWLGDGELPNLSVEDRSERDKQLLERKRREDKAREDELVRNRKSAFAMWLNAKKEIRDTPVDAYLTSRGIDLRLIGQQPGAIRYIPDHKHFDTETGEETTWPCMIVLMTQPDGSYGAVHRTWLKPDGSGKAPVTPARKIFPSYKGCVARLGKGESGLSPEEAEKAGKSGPVFITEGIEDGLSLLISDPRARIWVAGSVANIGNVPALPCVSSFILWGDNDWKPQAIKQFETAVEQVAAKGLPWGVVYSPFGKDANDLLLGKDDDDGKS